MKKNRRKWFGMSPNRKFIFLLQTIFLVTGMLCCVNIRAWGQAEPKVTLKLEHVTFVRVIENLRKQTGYEFVFNAQDVEHVKDVSLSLKDVSLEKAMEMLVNGRGLTFDIIERTVVIRKQDAVQDMKLVTIKGRIRDKNKNPIPGATVLIVGSTRGVASDPEGNFSISAQPTDVLRVSFIGYDSKTIEIRGKTFIEVVLEESEEQLEEVVANGIYTRNIESFTGSISTFKGEELKTIGAQNILRSLSALDPSVIITENNLQGSNPNARMDITINGKMSITDLEQEYETDPNQPLFILDGFETTLQTIVDLNMDRVESISILKDASSTAIYGSKAANGVIVIETKKPQPGKLRLNYNGSLTIGWADLSDYNLMNSAQKLEFEKLSGVYKVFLTGEMGSVNLDPNGEIISDVGRKEYYEKLKTVKEGLNTYWLNEPLQTAYTHAHNLYIDGGDQAFRYGVGLSYNKNMGVMKNSTRDILNGNITLTYRVDKFSFTNQTTIANTFADNETVAFQKFSRMNPFYMKRTEKGKVAKYVHASTGDGVNYSYIWNPLWDMKQNSFRESTNNAFTNNFQMEWHVYRSLRLRGNFSYSLTKQEGETFVSPNETGEAEKDVMKRGSYTKSSSTATSYNGRVNLTYGEMFGRHTLNVAGGVQFTENKNKADAFSAQGYMTDQFSNPNFSVGYTEGSRPQASDTKTRSVSFYSNLNYAYDMRYLADFNFASNGASQFGVNDPFTATWSVGVGWNLHNESFLKNQNVINYLKLRYSYGNPGNQNFDAKLSGNIYGYTTKYVNPFGLSAMINTWGNNDLKWQKTKTHNWGINGTLLGNRLNFAVDYQLRKNKPMLVRIDLPSSTGALSAPMNIGATKNYSISANVTYYLLKQKDMNWYISGNINHNETKYYNVGNVLEKFNEEGRASNSLLRIYDGASISALYTVRSAGIDPATGNEIFIRKDGTYTYEYNIDDEVLYGDSNPDVSGTLNTSFTYKGFSCSVAFSYSLGADIQLSTLLNKVENISEDMLKYNQDARALTARWKKPGDRAKFKRIDDTTPTYMSSRFMETENTLKCTSINLGYRTSTAHFLKYIGASSFSVNAYMNDIFRLSSVKEERGLDYPFQRSVTISLGVSF